MDIDFGGILEDLNWEGWKAGSGRALARTTRFIQISDYLRESAFI